MKKIIGLLIFGLFLLFSSNSLFADAYDDCFEIERIKAKSDGLGAVASAEQAGKICRAKLGVVIYFTLNWMKKILLPFLKKLSKVT